MHVLGSFSCLLFDDLKKVVMPKTNLAVNKNDDREYYWNA